MIDKDWHVKLYSSIVTLIMAITMGLFWFKLHSQFFHSFSLVLTFFVIGLEIFTNYDNQKRRKNKQPETSPLIGFIFLLVPVFMAVGCSILNSAFWGETKLNQQILGFFLCFYSIIFLFISGAHIRWIIRKTDKSQEYHDKHDKQLAELSIAQQAEHDRQNGKIDSLCHNVADIKKITHHVQVNITEADQKLMESIEKVFEGTIRHNQESLVK